MHTKKQFPNFSRERKKKRANKTKTKMCSPKHLENLSNVFIYRNNNDDYVVLMN